MAPSTLEAGSFNAFYANQQVLPPAKKISNVLMMYIDIINQKSQQEYHAAVQSNP
jgi:hypothetical protein